MPLKSPDRADVVGVRKAARRGRCPTTPRTRSPRSPASRASSVVHHPHRGRRSPGRFCEGERGSSFSSSPGSCKGTPSFDQAVAVVVEPVSAGAVQHRCRGCDRGKERVGRAGAFVRRRGGAFLRIDRGAGVSQRARAVAQDVGRGVRVPGPRFAPERSLAVAEERDAAVWGGEMTLPPSLVPCPPPPLSSPPPPGVKGLAAPPPQPAAATTTATADVDASTSKARESFMKASSKFDRLGDSRGAGTLHTSRRRARDRRGLSDTGGANEARTRSAKRTAGVRKSSPALLLPRSPPASSRAGVDDALRASPHSPCASRATASHASHVSSRRA